MNIDARGDTETAPWLSAEGQDEARGERTGREETAGRERGGTAGGKRMTGERRQGHGGG
jgi:hypothetical protein